MIWNIVLVDILEESVGPEDASDFEDVDLEVALPRVVSSAKLKNVCTDEETSL